MRDPFFFRGRGDCDADGSEILRSWKWVLFGFLFCGRSKEMGSEVSSVGDCVWREEDKERERDGEQVQCFGEKQKVNRVQRAKILATPAFLNF